MTTTSVLQAEARVLEILDAYLAELRAGRTPDRDALLAQHPELAESLAASFRALDFVQGAGRALEAPEGSANREEPPEAGRVLGDYRILRELGRGGMAVVYEAEQVSLGRHVALKVLPFAAVLDAKQLQRFKNEAQAAAQLQHPHIVPVHAVGCERGVHYYAMQYVEGQSLAVAIRELKERAVSDPTQGSTQDGPKTPLSSHGSNRTHGFVRMAAQLGIQAAQALDHAHHVGIVHRDVKPGNLLIDLAGTLWITDFGLAHSMKDVGLTMTGELLGTIRYMSPEQALAKRVPIDHRTDVYSLGATLYELLTLEPAFPGDDPHVVLRDIASKEPIPPRRLNPALPRDLETVLLKAMAKDPGGRYATAQEMADDLSRFLENRPVEAKRPGLLRRTVKWGRRHRVFVGAAAAVLLLGVAGLATGTALLWREQEQTQSAFRRAESNLALAMNALDEIYVEEPGGNPRLREGLPRDLLERGLEFYEAFARANEHNKNVAVTMGSAYHRTSLIYRALGQKDQADASLDRAVSICRQVVRSEPDNFDARFTLGYALYSKNDYAGAIHEYREAIRLLPDNGVTHDNLANALSANGDHEAAVREYREAIRLQPGNTRFHYNLGNTFFDAREYDRAIPEYLEAIRLDPDNAQAHHNLGNTLKRTGDPDGAIRECREAIRLRPGYALAHNSLALALAEKDPDEAVREFREAIRFRPDFAEAYSGLGHVLHVQHKLDGAIEAFRAAIQARPDDPEAHCNLGTSLAFQGDPDAANASYREAIRLDPDYALAHCNLGLTLQGQGLFKEALKSLQKGHELASKLPGWAYPSKEWLETAERKARLEGRLDQVLSGKVRPADALERVAFAEMLYAKSLHVESARMYAEAFAESPTLAEDLANGHRYNASCAASLAAAHGGADAAEWRGRALEWLRADLAAREKAASGLRATLEHWKKDPDLAAVRDRPAEIPESEREAWRGLWVAVDAALTGAR